MSKNYRVKNTDLFINNKLIPEGSVIPLDDKEAENLADYLEVVIETEPSLPKIKSGNRKNHKINN